MTKRVNEAERWVLFVQGVVLIVGIVIIAVGLAADWLGNREFQFGPDQRAVVLAGFIVLVIGLALRLNFVKIWLRRHMHSLAMPKVTLGRILLAMTSVLLTFLLIDFASRWFLPTRAPIEMRFPVGVARKPKPYTMFGGAESGKVSSEELNSLGYREKMASASNNTNDEYRIFILGGSTVFNGNPPIPVLLEEEFKRNGAENVNVYNFGVVASVSGMELSRIVFEISELRPDLIVMYNGGNDILHPYSWDPRPGYPFNFIVYENNPLLESEVGSYPSVALFLYGSNTFRYLFRSYFVKKFIPLEQLREEVGWGSEAWRNSIAETYVDNLVKADKISKAFGAEFIVFFQPLVYSKDPPTTEEKKLIDPVIAECCMDIRERILSEAEKPDFSTRFVDLSDIYDGVSETVFKDSIHTRQESKAVVVRKMYECIVNYFEVGE